MILVVPARLLLPELSAHGVKREAGPQTDQAARAVEGALAAQVDDTRQRAAGILGLRRATELHSFDAVDRHLLELERAIGTRTARGRHAGTRQRRAVERDGSVLRIEPAQADRTRIGLDVVDHHAGKIFQELAHVALGDRAERIRREHAFRLDGILLLHDRLGVALALRRHDELAQLDHVTVDHAGERDIERRGLSRHDRDRLLLGIEALEGEAHPLHARWHAGDGVDAARLGGRAQPGADDGDDRIAQIFPRTLIQDTSGNGAGARLLGEQTARSEKRGQQRDSKPAKGEARKRAQQRRGGHDGQGLRVTDHAAGRNSPATTRRKRCPPASAMRSVRDLTVRFRARGVGPNPEVNRKAGKIGKAELAFPAFPLFLFNLRAGRVTDPRCSCATAGAGETRRRRRTPRRSRTGTGPRRSRARRGRCRPARPSVGWV